MKNERKPYRATISKFAKAARPDRLSALGLLGHLRVLVLMVMPECVRAAAEMRQYAYVSAPSDSPGSQLYLIDAMTNDVENAISMYEAELAGPCGYS